MAKDISELLGRFNFEIKERSLFIEAMTHKSYSAENNLKYDNQRLEFLGDAVLQILLTEYLYLRYPEEQEGQLTKMRSALVRQEAFAKLAKDMCLDEFMRMGKGELRSNGQSRKSTLCDAFEALAGAIYLNAGLEHVSEVVMPMLREVFPDPKELLSNLNPKGILQEYTQKYCNSLRPEYRIDSKVGPDHDCEYSISVLLNGKVVGSGKGKSRKSAEVDAAVDAMNYFRTLKIDKCTASE